jgi:hypothetical protein
MPQQTDSTVFTGWWDFAMRAFALLTEPRADIERCDRDVEALARSSAACNALHRLSLAVRREWALSRSRRAAVAAAGALRSEVPAVRWRIAGWMVSVVGVTALVGSRFATSPNGPLAWVMPALLVTIGLFVMVCAAPLARAAADRRRVSS